ncbi:MAG: SDR family NAD(P)-dependent oxidoreductase, partial [Pseudomonadota bacterium]
QSRKLIIVTSKYFKVLNNLTYVWSTYAEGGLYSPPFLAAYNTSKFAVVGLMQSVARELQAIGSNVSASVYCPGAVHSNILQTSENRPAGATRSTELSRATEAFRGVVTDVVGAGMDPAAAAACVIDGMRRDQFWVFSHENVPEVALRQAEEMASARTLTDL